MLLEVREVCKRYEINVSGNGEVGVLRGEGGAEDSTFNKERVGYKNKSKNIIRLFVYQSPGK